MKMQHSLLLLGLLVATTVGTTAAQQCVAPFGRSSASFILGVNVPWHFYGWDFDDHYLWGTAFDASFWNTTFASLRRAGGDTARIFIFCDGRASPQFHPETREVQPLSATFFKRLDTVVAQAKANDVRLMLVLWNHDALQDHAVCCGRYAGMHLDLFLQPTAYFERVLKPLVQHYRNESTVWAWDLMNEPEFAMTETGKGYTTQLVPFDAMMRFMIESTRIIHTLSPGALVSVGAAHPDTMHLWTDDSLRYYGSGPDGLLDMIQVHVYPWSPRQEAILEWMKMYPKPVLVGETPPRVGPYRQFRQLLDAYVSNGLGVLYWAYYSGDTVLGNWTDMEPLITTFRRYVPLESA